MRAPIAPPDRDLHRDLARARRHRRPVPVRPGAEAGVAHGHDRARTGRARRAARRQARVREGLGPVGPADQDDDDRAPATLSYRAGTGRLGGRRSCGRSSAGRTSYLTPASGRCEGALARLRGHRHPDRRAGARGHDRGAGPRRRPGRLAARSARTTAGRPARSTGWRNCCGTSGVRIGVVTDGRWWAIVSARPETMVASGIIDSQRWIELPAVRNAFIAAAAPAPPDRRQARGPAHRAVRRVGRRRRGDHRGTRHAGPPRGRTAGAGAVRGRARRPATAASRTRCPPTATRSTRPRSP